MYVDSLEAQRLCEALYRRTFPLIAYGTRFAPRLETSGRLIGMGCDVEKYFLFVGRLIPEKGVHYLIEAYRRVDTEFPFVIVGDNPYDPEYVQQIKDAADERVRFVGSEFGEPRSGTMRPLLRVR